MTSKTLKGKQPGKSKTETAFEKKIPTERWGLVLIILLTFITYSGSLKNGFCWDDSQNICTMLSLRTGITNDHLSLLK